MISEKTVELNLSMEIINYINYRNNSSVFAVGPSQRQEAKLGYDVEIGSGTGSAILIQYKRAELYGNEYQYHINYTANKNQHEILLDAEKNGFTVLYAFPLFHLVSQISTHRRRLLQETAWYRPSQIILPGGPVGRHTLHINRATRKSYVTSDPSPIESPLEFSEVDSYFQLLKSQELKTLKDLADFLNSKRITITEVISNEKLGEKSWEDLSQQFILTSEQ